jgi:hypothetical protein
MHNRGIVLMMVLGAASLVQSRPGELLSMPVLVAIIV